MGESVSDKVKELAQKMEKYTIYIYMFLAIALSNTVFFGLVHRKLFLVLAILAIIAGAFWITLKIKAGEYGVFFMINVLIFAAFSVLIVLGWMFSGEMSNSSFRNNYIGFITSFMLTLIMTMLFKKKQIALSYIDYMVGISIVSLVCFALTIFLPDVAARVPMSMDESGHFYTFFYTWGWDDHGTGLCFLNRNCGPFWEPGAFQGFLIIAVLFAIRYGDSIKNIDKKLILLFITIISTVSTTGLLLLVMICIVWRKKLGLYLMQNVKNKEFVKKILIAAFAIFIAWLLFSGVIFDKLASYTDSTVSAGIRFNDLKYGIGLCFIKPLFGVGFGTTAMDIYEDAVGIKANSNGLIMMFYTMGNIFGILYVYLMSKGIIRFFEEKGIIKKIALIVTLVILHATECLFVFPVYLIFIFDFHYNEEGVNGKNVDFGKIKQKITGFVKEKKR